MGLGGLSDDQLIGVIAAARRMESRAAWYSTAAISEWAVRAAGRDPLSEFAADEPANELNLTWQSAAGQMGYARDVAERLPRTFAAPGMAAIARVRPLLSTALPS